MSPACGGSETGDGDHARDAGAPGEAAGGASEAAETAEGAEAAETAEGAEAAEGAVEVAGPGVEDTVRPEIPGLWQETVASREAGGPGRLRAVRIAGHDAFDRLVFEFAGELPGYEVGYPDGPLHQCGSGRPIDPGAPQALRVRLRPAEAHDDMGEPTVVDRDRSPRLPVLRTARLTCDFEGDVEWVLGVGEKVAFRVLTLDGPARIVVDLRRP